jgi:hypothetical protein
VGFSRMRPRTPQRHGCAVTISTRTFLVDSYVPGMDVQLVRNLVNRIATVDGRMSWLCVLAIPEEETVTCVVRSAERTAVVEALLRAGLSAEHVTEVLLIEAPGHP